jgi:Fe-S-cluster containining protein
MAKIAAFVVHRSKQITYIVPECQRCGKCCHNLQIIPLWISATNHTCKHLVEPNVCTIQGTKPDICKDYPVMGGAGVYDTCAAYRAAVKRWRRYWTAWVGTEMVDENIINKVGK